MHTVHIMPIIRCRCIKSSTAGTASHSLSAHHTLSTHSLQMRDDTRHERWKGGVAGGTPPPPLGGARCGGQPGGGAFIGPTLTASVAGSAFARLAGGGAGGRREGGMREETAGCGEVATSSNICVMRSRE